MGSFCRTLAKIFSGGRESALAHAAKQVHILDSSKEYIIEVVCLRCSLNFVFICLVFFTFMVAKLKKHTILK